ncbi:MAG TPA: putative baseplate assembly protein [Longimicrobium sp.]|nr:putative baseplate assembly protein [Longimicrobium sp.]
MTYRCCDETRREAVRAHATLNGIDWLEVLDGDAPAGSPRQRTLLLRCLKVVPATFGAENVRIEGGDRIRPVQVEWAAPAASIPGGLVSPAEQAFLAGLDKADHVLAVRTDSAGDFSAYTLRLIASALDALPPAGFDPRLSEVDFSFKVECPTPFDCAPPRSCPTGPAPEPEIDYLAKDYASFRRLLLDRLSLLVPGWHERSAADQGVVLAELLAYVGDHLSYRQDAVAAEAYLDTARRRVSLRRHARLVDYAMHDGRNARAWVQLEISADLVLAHGDARFYTRLPGFPARMVPDSPDDKRAREREPVVFEPVHGEELFAAHDTLDFYTWGDRACCLVRGATRATLAGHFPYLRPGHVLAFVEVMGPRTGVADDADPAHRHVVRLTEVVHTRGGSALTDPLDGTLITGIAWDAEDALPFPLCVSSELDDGTLVDGVSVARGNVVLADHGLTRDEDLGAVPAPRLFAAPCAGADPCAQEPPVPLPPRFRPRLSERPLTQAGPHQAGMWIDGKRWMVPLRQAPAARALRREMAGVLPELWLTEDPAGAALEWDARRDLLSSGAAAREFVAEVEDDGTAALRFGDDRHGRRPETGVRFAARYRVGNGRAGNVGAEAIAHVVAADARILRAWNPLAAAGGADPETAAEVRRRAPDAFRTQERAVTSGDYEAMSGRHPQVQRAAATRRWTGSWHTVFVTVDRAGTLPVDAAFERELLQHLERYRLAGEDLEADAPRWVPLEVEMQVCVAPGYLRADVHAALLRELGSGVLPGGRRGPFHPDNLTFGQTLYLSPLYAAARRVPGVESAEVTAFHRQGVPDPLPLRSGRMTLGRLQIARLDNDPNYPERGVLRLALHGGR